MHRYPDVITVNTRKLKKIIKKLYSSTDFKELLAKYKGAMIVCGDTGYGYLCATQQCTRISVPHTLSRRIRNNKHLRIEA